MASFTLTDIDALTNGKLGTFDVACPECGPGRKSPQNRKRPVLRIWRTDASFASFKCARCGLEGFARDGGTSSARPAQIAKAKAGAEARDREAAAEQLRKAKFLWTRRRPAEASPVERYLRQMRGYGGGIPASIGYLPPSKPEHHPAMIAAFAWPIEEPEPGVLDIPDNALHGIHLTLLRPDGLGKAGTGRDKIMLGRSIGTPIVPAPMNDLLGLVICEGIETGLSLFEATGCGVWAAGAASRMPALADAVPDYACVTVAAEPDEAGSKHATELARRLRARGIYTEQRLLADGEMAT
jgi:hypothetical protein